MSHFAIDTPSEITLQPPESQRPKIYLIFKLKSKETTRGNESSKSPQSGKAEDIAKVNSGRDGGHSSSSRLALPSYGRNPLGAGDGHDEDDEDPKKPLTNDHEDSDVSSDNSEKRLRRWMIRKGKRAQGKNIKSGDHSSNENQPVDPVVSEELPEEDSAVSRISSVNSAEPGQFSRNAVDRWFLGVPSPFTGNEIGDATPPELISPSARSEGLPKSSRNAFANDNILTDPSQATVMGRSKSNPDILEASKKDSGRPRRNSMVDAYIRDGHPRVGTKFPNMAIEGYGRACGMPTTAQLHTLAGKRYTFYNENGKRVLMNPLPIPTKISERSNLTPRDTSFPGPSRKQLLADAGSSHNSTKAPSFDKFEITCVAALGNSSRGREVVVQPSNTAREESEGRPGWRKTVLVQAHVITGENTRHTPWVASVRPLELERSGFAKESGYGTFPESRNGSISNYSIITEDEIPLVHGPEAADVSVVEESAMILSAQQSADVPTLEEPAMIPRLKLSAGVPTVEESVKIQGSQESADSPMIEEPMVEEPAMIPRLELSAGVPTVEESVTIQGSQESSDSPMIEEPAMIPSAQQPANGTSITALVDRTRSHGALPPTTLDRGVSATSPTQRRSDQLPWGRTNGEFFEFNAETLEDLGTHGPVTVCRETGQLYEGPQVLHIERNPDPELSPPRQSSFTFPDEISMDNWVRVPLRTDATSVSEGPAPAMSVGSHRTQDGQDRPGSAAPVDRNPRQSTDSNESRGVCGCSPFESLVCIVCGLFQKRNLPSQDHVAPPTSPVQPEPAISLSLLNQTALSQAAGSNSIRAPSTGGTEWRQIDWNVHSAGSRTVDVTPESGTRATSDATLELAQVEDPPSPRAKVPRDDEASGKREGI